MSRRGASFESILDRCVRAIRDATYVCEITAVEKRSVSHFCLALLVQVKH